ncbi:MAG: dephospho-CoA kinase [Gammaproteobacteria bacterium]
MLVIGLTGGIGSGKSAVAKLFSERGVTVIDTDQLSRDVTQPGQPALEQIAEKFGRDILLPDGGLNRTALRKLIFIDENKRQWLEQLLHPLIRAEMQRQIEAARPPYCIVVIPLLLEKESNPLIDRILIVDALESDQIKRTQIRDNASPDEIKSIIKTQVTRPERLAKADDIIDNNGALIDLIPQVDRLHGFYTALAQKDAFNNK